MTTKNTSVAGERTQTTKPTKTPWHVQIVNGKTMIACHPFADDGSMQIAEVTRLKAAGKTQANARLLAAAPELLESLRELVGFLEAYPHHFSRDIREFQNAANEALDKAEGKAL